MRKIITLAMTMMLVILIAFPVMAETEQTNHEYTEIFAGMTEEDYLMLERVVYHEAACVVSPDVPETYEQLFPCCVAVVETVCNRVLSGEWPNTVSRVCTQKSQFVCRKYRSENALQDQMVSDAINYVLENGRTQLPSTKYVYFSRYKQGYATNYVWIGARKRNGNVWIGRGMEFGEPKK